MFGERHVLTDDTIDFRKYLTDTDATERVRPVEQYRDQLNALLKPQTGPRLPRLPFVGTSLEFRPGEVTVWAGFNSSGKSLLQGQVMTDFALAGERICIASFEMKPRTTLERMVRQYLRRKPIAEADNNTFIDLVKGQMWLYDQQGMVKSDRLIAVVKHSAEVLGCSQIAIDSLMKCVRGEDDYNAQKDFLDGLTTAARDYGVHIHLVHHMRKPENGSERMPTRMDLRGSVSITDQVDNVLLLWRNEKKERECAAGKPVELDDPDAMILCDKQRNGEWQGRAKLWYWHAAQRFMDTRSAA